MLYDISPPITTALQTWPGDTPFRREVLLDMTKGDNITLSTLHTTVHLGSHADGPNHYGRNAYGIGEMPLEHYLGPCQVLEVNVPRATRIKPTDLFHAIDGIVEQRVLFKTGTYPDPTVFSEDFAGLSAQLISALAARGVITIGVDTPSVDLFADKKLEAHNTILRHGIAILEGLMLGNVPAGTYELIALPLKLIGVDASPVRAVLRSV